MCKPWVSDSAKKRRKESPIHASQREKKIDIRWKRLNYFLSLTMYQMIWHSFQSIWVIFSADSFSNSFHAHICRQLDESSLALNCAHCRPVSLICKRKWVWPLNFWESRDPLTTHVFTLWSWWASANISHSCLSHLDQYISRPVLLLHHTTSNRSTTQLESEKTDHFTFLYLWGKVNLSMVVWTAPRLTLPNLSSSCRSSCKGNTPLPCL